MLFSRVSLDAANTGLRLCIVAAINRVFRLRKAPKLLRRKYDRAVKAAKSLRRSYEKEIFLPYADRFSAYIAALRRGTLRHATFIGVTGSCGKTTTTRLVHAILSTVAKCHTGTEWNRPRHVVETVNTFPLSARFCVQELSGGTRGTIAESVNVLRPDIGVVLNVASDHYKAFRNLEATASEKGRLIEKLPRSGIAILNADDPHVRLMAARTQARVLTFGISPDADIRAIEVSGRWPERLCLTVTYKNEITTVHTQLVGDHWTPSVLAAMACGIACGLSLATCAEGVSACSAAMGRCSVHERPDGAAYVLDTHKAPFWTLSASYAFIRDAQASRKTMVIGTVSDYPGERSRRYRRIAREALQVADRAVFVGSSASHVSNLRQGELRDRLFNFETVYQASAFLAADPLAGELIYVKASGNEHLERIMLRAIDRVVCWREKCGQYRPCQRCKYYSKPAPPPFSVADLLPGMPKPHRHLT
jgi:UDP-N-acetylmuramoyl-tripeptide--D-alanyl-D-alanine ligase